MRWKYVLGFAAAAVWVVAGLRAGTLLWVDDAFISFHYARSLAEGQGLTFNPEDGPLEGFTNLAWVLLLALGMKLHLTPEGLSRAVGLCSWVSWFALTGGLVWRAARSWKAVTIGVVGLGALALPADFVALAGNGLETSTVAALALVLGLFLQPLGERRLGWAFALALGACQLLLVALRPDASLYVFAWGLLAAVRLCRATRPWHRGAWELLRLESLALLGLVALLVWKQWYFGSLVPNTFFAKNADVSSWVAGWEYWRVFLRNSPQAWLLVPLAVVATLPGPGSAFARYALLATALYVVYCARVGGDFMGWRFAFQVYPLLTAGALLGLVRLAEGPAARWLAWPALVASAGVAALSTTPRVHEMKYGMQEVETMHRFVVDGLAVGEALREVLPADTRISTTLAGTIPYASRLVSIDQWGLADRQVASATSAPVTTRGHTKPASLQYLRARRVDLVLGHPALCSCSAPCEDGAPDVFIRLQGTDTCVRTRLLSRSPAFVRFICQPNARLALRHVECEPFEAPRFRRVEPAVAEELGHGATLASFDALPAGAVVRGPAFGVVRPGELLPGQQPVTGATGGYLSSFHGGDESRGMVRLPLPAGTRALSLRIAGGSNCEHVYAAVISKDVLLSRACGDDSEHLRAVTLAVPQELAEEPLELVLVDDSREPWGHLLIDEVAIRRASFF